MIRLANDIMAVEILPESGGRIENLYDLRTGKNWLWHPRSQPAREKPVPVGSSFDDHFTGGWEEVFPNDMAQTFHGRDLADHGELWSQAWNVIETQDYGIELALRCKTVPVAAKKTITLDRKLPRVSVKYSFSNLFGERLGFLFKLHPAISVEAGDEIIMPPCCLRPVALGFSRVAAEDVETTFPMVLGRDGRELPLNKIPPESARTQEFVYASRLEGSSCGIHNQSTGTKLMLHFDTKALPFTWIFQSFGLWKGHYVVFMEPCTNKHYDLSVGEEKNEMAFLDGHGTWETTVVAEITPAG